MGNILPFFPADPHELCPGCVWSSEDSGSGFPFPTILSGFPIPAAKQPPSLELPPQQTELQIQAIMSTFASRGFRAPATPPIPPLSLQRELPWLDSQPGPGGLARCCETADSTAMTEKAKPKPHKLRIIQKENNRDEGPLLPSYHREHPNALRLSVVLGMLSGREKASAENNKERMEHDCLLSAPTGRH